MVGNSIEQRVEDYVKTQSNYHIYEAAFDPTEVTNLWSQAIREGIITSADRVFYLTVDILRMRLGEDWTNQKDRENLTALERFRERITDYDRKTREYFERKLAPTKYSLLYKKTNEFPPSDALSLLASYESFKAEPLELRREPTVSGDIAGVNFFNWDKFHYRFGKTLTIPELSRFYSEKPRGPYNWAYCRRDIEVLYEIPLTPIEFQTMGRRLWQAHVNTPILTPVK